MDFIMNKTLLMVPSRNRPQNIERLAKALLDTATSVDLFVGIDEDDSHVDAYADLSRQYKFKLRIGPRKRFGPMLNELGMPFVENYKYMGWCGDDHLPITKGWDEIYRQELDKIDTGVVYGNDLVQGKSIATQLAFTSNIAKELGYIVPDDFIHLFIDNYFMVMAESIGKLVYLPEVIVQHLHYSAGSSQEDQTYKEANSPANWSNDRQRFEDYVNNELPRDKEKLERLINNE